jgi:hypothetical protein
MMYKSKVNKTRKIIIEDVNEYNLLTIIYNKNTTRKKMKIK